VDTRVVDVLGRAPLDPLERARAKQQVYRANPGLLTAIVKAERAERLERASGTPVTDHLAAALAALEQAQRADDASKLAGDIQELITQLAALTGQPTITTTQKSSDKVRLQKTVEELDRWAERYAAKLRKQLGMGDE
jgi:hypothetical protein